MLDAILARLRAQPSRTGSLVITLYGDVVAPRGGSLWLGTTIALFGAIGVADGVVRTAVSRLAADGWLVGTRRGRRSFYRLTEQGRIASEAAAARIYATASPPWSGAFHLAVVDPGPERDATRSALTDAGWGSASPGLMVAPDTAALPDIAGLLLLRGEATPEDARRLVDRAWRLEDLAQRYRRFLAIVPDQPAQLTGQDALIARLLLIHEYRRVVLRDPNLPADILPEDWPGHEARARCSAAYRALRPASEEWLSAWALNEDGALPHADRRLADRFG